MNCVLANLTFLFLGSVVFPALALDSVQTQPQPSKFLAEAQAKQLNPAVSLSNLPALAPNQPKHSASLLVKEQTKQPATADNSTPLPNPADNQTELPPPSTRQLQQSSPEQPQTPANNNTDKLFETIFGQPKTREHIAQVVVPFFINEQQSGEVLVLLSPGNIATVRFQAAPLLTQTAKILRSDIQQKLQAAVDSEGNLTLEVLRQNGLEATFDDRQLELRIQVPPVQRKTSIYNLREQGLPPEAENALRPSAMSGYINLRGGQDYLWSGTQGTATGRQPLQLNLEGALNWKGWVLEGSSTFTERTDPLWVRGDLRLVHDAPDQALRYVIGDLSVPISGYQSSRPLLGVAVARNFSLQPYRVTRPISQFEFFLETPSKVEVFINGLPVQTLQLPAGRQDIRDLPLSGGINDVQLIITDAVGRVQRLNFPAAVARELLSTGLKQFAYSFGFPSQAENGGYSYSWERPALYLAYRQGLSNTLTMGAYFQGDPKQQLLGWEGAWATSYGNLGWDAAFSHASDIGTDYAFRLRYEYLQSGLKNSSQRTLRLALEHQGDGFTTADELTSRKKFGWDLSANYSQRLFANINTNLGLDYQFGRSDVLDTYGASLGLSKGFGNGLGVNLNYSYRKNDTGNDEQRVFLNLFYSLPRQRQSIIASTNINSTGSPSNQVTWNYNSRKTIGGINASVGALVGSNNYGITSRLDYTGYRFTTNLSHDLNILGGKNESIGNLTKLTFGTALVFADGHFGWSRPINNSFALVVPNQNLRGQIIGINPSGGGYTARADSLGPAVVPDLSSYSVSSLRIDASDLPLGYDLGREIYNLLPSYKSGTLIRIGTEATVFLRGVLLDAKGEPVGLQAAEVRSLSDPNWQPVTLFTNKVGKFALEGFKPGKYELRLNSNQQNVIHFEVPPKQTGIYDIGPLKIPVPVK